MDKTYRTEFCRRYLIEALPEPLTRASRHLQIFDNYITGTRIRIRTVRDPETKEWTWTMQQRLTDARDGPLFLRTAEICLNEAEHTVFEPFEGNEIRKNRYFHDFDGRSFAFDIYLGKLWGLNIATVDLPDERTFAVFPPPSFAIFDITSEAFFLGDSLVDADLEKVRDEIGRLERRGLVRHDVAE